MAEYQPSFETLVRLAVERGVLLASLLQRYQLRYHLNDAHFSEHLHCTMDNLIHLKLCDLPRSDHFQEDIERIAEHTHGDVVALTRILNEQTHLERLHQFLKERGFTGTLKDERNGIVFQQGQKRLTIEPSFLEKQAEKQLEGIAISFMHECQG